MRKNLVLYVCLFILFVPVFGQDIVKTEYKAIDPFDYKLEEDKPVTRRVINKYKSVVEFVSEKKSDSTVFYEFVSLDKRPPTTLRLIPNPDSQLKPPAPGQTVTIYYTMNKLRTVSVVLDAYEDNRNKDEKGIGVVKSSINPAPSTFRKSDYIQITPDKYKDDEQDYQDDENERKYYVILQFESQDGIFLTFLTPENTDEKPAFLKKKWHVGRRYPYFNPGQKMTVYFTAKKETNDHLYIDDIVVMN